MDVTQLPFNQFIGLKYSDNPDFLLMLDDRTEYLNHLETTHASALFALAEATSGHFLLQEFRGMNDIIPVVRKVEIKYRKPSQGKIFSKAKFIENEKDEITGLLIKQKRVLIKVEVSLFDNAGNMTMQSVFEWFVAKQ